MELDGKAFHLAAADWERDLARQNELMMPGRIVLRFTWRMLTGEPDRVAAQMRQALAATDDPALWTPDRALGAQ